MTDEFNPADHTVAETQAHLDTASPDEFKRVQDAEKAGANRKGIVEYVQSEDAQPEPDEDGYWRRVVSS